MLDRLKKNQDLLYQLGGIFVGFTVFQMAYSDALLVLIRKQNIGTVLNLVLDSVAVIVGVWLIGYCGINFYRLLKRRNRKK